jgi:sarcosine oxidase
VTKPERADVVVIGAGLLGLATAYALRGRRDVVVLERADVGHPRGGSHGPSRVFRLGYPDPFYVDLARRSLAGWRALEAETGTELVQRTGQLSFGPGAREVFDALVSVDAPVEGLGADEVARRFPMFAGRGPAVFEPESGVLAANVVLAALRGACACDIREHVEVTKIEEDGDRVRIETDAGSLDANAAVVTAGPWTSQLVTLPTPTFATLEHVAYFRPHADATATPPVFISHDAPTAYGLPTPGSDLYKIALHHGGVRVDPDGAPFSVDPEAIAALEAAARHWLVDFGPVAVEVDVCPYDNTPDEDFVIERRGNVAIGCGTSGHGFKFGPLLGEILAALAESRDPPVDITRFRPR